MAEKKAEKRKDSKGRKLETGERFDSKNHRYVFQRMIDGERISITAKTLEELRRQKNEALCRIDKGGKINSKNSKMSLNEYFDYWFETFARSGRKATSAQNNLSYYNAFVRKTIGKKAISQISKADCQKIINKMIEDGKAHSSMANLKSTLNIVFESAVDDDIILKNPARNLQIPHTEAKKRTAIEKQQIDIFLDYVKKTRRYEYCYPVFVILFNLGLRIGEVCALTWQDIDFKNNSVSVNKTLNRYRKAEFGFTLGIASPKSKTSIRTVQMNSVVKKILLKEKMRNTHSDAELPLVDDSGHIRGNVKDFIFLNKIGKPWNEPTFNDLIKRIVQSYNAEAEKEGKEQLKEFCPHMARHTYTSLCYAAGADIKIVSELLGHASTQITLDAYTHLQLEDKKRQQEEVAQMIKIS